MSYMGYFFVVSSMKQSIENRHTGLPSLEGRRALLYMGSVTLVINEGKDLFLTWLSECMCCVCSRLQAARDKEALQSKDRTSIYSMHACVHFVCVSSLSITSVIMLFYIIININLSLTGNLSKLTHVACTLPSVCPPSISLYTPAISPINLFNVMRPRGGPKRGCDESVLLFLAKTQSRGQNINTALCCWNVTLRKYRVYMELSHNMTKTIFKKRNHLKQLHY